MHIVILGAGGVGGYFGGRLSQHGVDVTFFVRPKREEQLKSRGLRVKSIHGDFSLSPKIATSVEQVPSPDVVIVALKNYHLTNALPVLRQFVERGAVILPLLNGVEHLRTLVEQFGTQHVLGGSCYIEATLDENSDVVHTSSIHDIVFGPLESGDMNWLNALSQTLKRGEFRVRLSEHIRLDMWRKYLFLSSFSGITAATRQPIKVALQDAATREFLTGMLIEGCSVAMAEGIPIDENEHLAILRRMEKAEPDMTSSMHRDLQKGLPMELESLQGALIRLAERHQIEVPHFRAVYALLHPYASGGLRSQEVL